MPRTDDLTHDRWSPVPPVLFHLPPTSLSTLIFHLPSSPFFFFFLTSLMCFLPNDSPTDNHLNEMKTLILSSRAVKVVFLTARDKCRSLPPAGRPRGYPRQSECVSSVSVSLLLSDADQIRCQPNKLLSVATGPT